MNRGHGALRSGLTLCLALAWAMPAYAGPGAPRARRAPETKTHRAPLVSKAPPPATARRRKHAAARREHALTLYDPYDRSVRRAFARSGPAAPERRHPLGATYLGGGKTAYVVWAPRAAEVEVAFFEGAVREPTRSVALTRGEDGYFHGTLAGVRPGARYKYVLRGGDVPDERMFPDPASRAQPDGVHGPSQVVDHRHAWGPGEATWRPPALGRLAIYQFHVGTFTREGTLGAAAERMGEVARTGFTAAQPLPVQSFPGARNWGYDPAQIYAVHERYGGPDGLRRFVEASHRAGMAAVLDVVYNHSGPEGNTIGAFGPYFEGASTPWGPGMTSSGAARPHVFRYFIENALHLVATYHVDGLRIDASHALPRPFLAELRRAVDALSKRLGRRVVLIAEDNQNDGALVTRGRGAERPLVDSQWSTDPWHAWRVLHTGERGSYLEDFAADPLRLFARGIRRGWIYEGQTSPSSGTPRGTSAGSLRGTSHVLPLGDHDQYGNTPTGARFASRVPESVQRSTDVLRYVLPVIPQVFMGDEWGAKTPFLYFVDHGDPALREATKAGRAAEFRAFFEGAGKEPPDPTVRKSFDASRLDHGEKRRSVHAKRLRLHRDLLALRRTHPALARMGKRSMQVLLHEASSVVVIRRWAPGGEVVAVFNVGDKPARVRLTEGEIVPLEDGRAERRRSLSGRFDKLLSSEDRRYGGAGGPASTFDGEHAEVTLGPHSAAVYGRTTGGRP